MPKFQVLCSETVLYRIEVEANTAEQAAGLVENGGVGLGDPHEHNGFQIDEVIALATAQ